ncbi:MAG TPA: ComEC/Rec2 family competence protein [Elusimicrobiota bacterium]|nr:ComEC/Rec2 family competence protein [Elusimicrobiota bacterium]
MKIFRLWIVLCLAPSALFAAAEVEALFRRDAKAYDPQYAEMTVVFLDVGQGDSTFIKTPNGRTVLIDGGGTPAWSDLDFEPGREVVVPFLEERGVLKLDYVVISHPHGDHIAGLLEVFRRVPVKNLVDPALEAEEPEYSELLKLAKKNKTEYVVVGEGDLLPIDPALEVRVLSPPRDYVYPDLNNSSCVLRITYRNVSFLLTGDIEEDAENRLAREYKNKLRSQILKVPHHGSRTSTSLRFLDLVKPETGIVMVGRGNLFGHPHPQSLSRFRARNILLYRTDNDGNVTVRTDGLHYKVTTAREAQ